MWVASILLFLCEMSEYDIEQVYLPNLAIVDHHCWFNVLSKKIFVVVVGAAATKVAHSLTGHLAFLPKIDASHDCYLHHKTSSVGIQYALYW